MRRTALHGRAFRRRRIAGAGLGADSDIGQAVFQQRKADAVQRQLQVFVYIVRQRLERRYIKYPGFIRQRRLQPLLHQPVDGGKKCRQGFTRAGGGGDQRRCAGTYSRPSLALHVRGRVEMGVEPLGDNGMKRC